MVLLILGPAGVGKSTLAACVAADLGYLHIEIDQYPEDGVDLAGLRREWDLFWRDADAEPLARSVAARAIQAGRAGAVLSFPSLVTLSENQLQTAQACGIRVFVLYGSEHNCRRAFVQREQASGRGLDVQHWNENNVQTHRLFGGSLYAAHRVEAFERGEFRPRRDLVAEVKRRAG